MSEPLDFINFHDGFLVATAGKRPSEAQWKLYCERVEKMRATLTAAPQTPAAKPALKAVPGDPATDPRFTPEPMPGNDAGPRLAKGQAMSAGPR